MDQKFKVSLNNLVRLFLFLFFSFQVYFIFCVTVLPTCMYKYNICGWYPGSSEKGIEPSVTGVRDGGCWELNPVPVQ